MNSIPDCLAGAPNLLLSRVLFRHGCRVGELSGGLINDPDRAVAEYLQVLTNLGDFDRNHWKTLVDEIQKDLRRKAATGRDVETLAEKPDIIVSGKLVGANPIRIMQTYKEFPSNIELQTTTTVGAVLGHMSDAGTDASEASLETACKALTSEAATAYLHKDDFKRKAAECIKNLHVEPPAVVKSASLPENVADTVILTVEAPRDTLARASKQNVSLQKIQTRIQYLKEFL
jgi:hypothetical protein